MSDVERVEVPADDRKGASHPPDCSTQCYDANVTSISQRELRNESGEIMRRLDAGESFIITRAGVPVGQLSPLRRQRFVTAEAVAEAFGGAPRIDADRFRSDLDAIADPTDEPRA